LKKIGLLLTALFVAAALVLAACGSKGVQVGKTDGSYERIQKAGKLRVAIDPTYPPMEYEGKDGKPEGFDIDFANELAKRLGVKAEFVTMDWDGIIAGLVSGRYDVIISSMNITDERLKTVNFVEYLQMSQVFVAKKGITVANEQDLAGKIVAVQADTTSHEWVDEAKGKGIAIREIKAYSGATDTFAAVKAGQADVIVVDEPVGRFYAKQDAATFAVTGQAIAPEPVGIAIQKNDMDLKAAIDKAVGDMRSDGTFKKLSDKWFGGELGK
jgi:ABC-type amino acid transport substrate-binding protein